MGARSAVTKLPVEVRKLLEEWLKDFLAGDLTLNEVMSRLEGHMALAGVPAEAAPSRSSVHRYSQGFEKVIQRVQRSRELTNLMAEQMAPAVSDGKGVQVLIEAVQGLAYDLFASIEEGTPIDAKTIHDLSKAAHHMAAAQKTDADRALKVEAETLKKAAAAATKLGKKLGWSAETARTVREEILGVKLAPPPAASE